MTRILNIVRPTDTPTLFDRAARLRTEAAELGTEALADFLATLTEVRSKAAEVASMDMLPVGIRERAHRLKASIEGEIKSIQVLIGRAK